MVAEMTETDIITQINVIDAEIAKIISTLGTPGSAGVNFVDYQMGNKRVDGSTRLKQLQDARTMYQGLLGKIPKVIVNDHGYDVDPATGVDKTDYQGDE
jgi:hypothetical protein